MALEYSKVSIHQREVDLKNKPQEMIKASTKATVPVLILENGHVIDESIDIISWALKQSDPDGWLQMELKSECDNLIYYNDIKFKPILDNYKYSQNSEDLEHYRENANVYLNQLNSLLMKNRYLLADHISFADVAIFPFIRQFYMVDQPWLDFFLNSELFLLVMKKVV